MTGKCPTNCPGPGYGEPYCGRPLTPKRKRCPACAKKYQSLHKKWLYRNDPQYRARALASNREALRDPERHRIKLEHSTKFNQERDQQARERRLTREARYIPWKGIYWVRQHIVKGSGRTEPMPQACAIVGETPQKYRIMCLNEPIRLENNDKHWLDLGEIYMVHKRFITKPPIEGLPQPPTWMQERSLMSSYKIGRNQPCPCGSGKKYKKCCEKFGEPKINEQGILREESRNPGYISALIAFCDEKLEGVEAAEGYRG